MAEANNKAMNDLRIGVIGVGNIGSAHTNCLLSGKIKGACLGAICDINTDRCLHFTKDNPELKSFSDYKELIASGLCDAVIVSVPHPLHADIAADCLNAGLHVLVEKPEDIRVTKARYLNDVAAKSGKTFAIMFNQRTNPLFIKARDMVKNGELGELKRTVWIITNWYRSQAYYDSGSWRATWNGEGGGVLLNQAPHNLDLWQWICGMPIQITAFCDEAKYHNIEVEDDVTIFARYANGATGAFMTSTGELPGTNRLEISGTKGKIVLENEVLKWWRLPRDEREICATEKSSFPNISSEYEEIRFDNSGSAHAGVIQAYVNNILDGTPLVANGYEGINELSISNAAYLSQWLGNKPIDLPFDEALFDELLAKKASTSQSAKTEGDKKMNEEYRQRWQTNWN